MSQNVFISHGNQKQGLIMGYAPKFVLKFQFASKCLYFTPFIFYLCAIAPTRNKIFDFVTSIKIANLPRFQFCDSTVQNSKQGQSRFYRETELGHCKLESTS